MSASNQASGHIDFRSSTLFSKIPYYSREPVTKNMYMTLTLILIN